MLKGTRQELVYLILGGIFVTNALLGEILGGKLIQMGPYVMSMGVLPWPVVFLTTDLINEYFGKPGVRKLTFLTVGLIVYAFCVIYASMTVPAAPISPVDDRSYSTVLGQSLWIIVGSVTAFLTSQLVDVLVFWMFRDKTGGKHLWLRATGSTAVSQIIDTFVVLGIAFWLPGKITTKDFLGLTFTNYTYKFLIAVSITPILYLAHNVIDRFLGRSEAHHMIEEAVVTSHQTTV
ncbi:MAG TPA: queuosine precursor transporter [Bryobacteraceae bacterium]|nr:queuosine precursor transporter [Bryobacteraceae bacterium]